MGKHQTRTGGPFVDRAVNSVDWKADRAGSLRNDAGVILQVRADTGQIGDDANAMPKIPDPRFPRSGTRAGNSPGPTRPFRACRPSRHISADGHACRPSNWSRVTHQQPARAARTKTCRQGRLQPRLESTSSATASSQPHEHLPGYGSSNHVRAVPLAAPERVGIDLRPAHWPRPTRQNPRRQ
jgi:hypothetical protein